MSILIGDLVVAILVSTLPPSFAYVERALDAVITTTLVFPILYFSLFRPIQKYNQLLERSQQALGEALDELEESHNALEDRVAERTKELARLNDDLLVENQSRQQAEESLRLRNRELQALQDASLAMSQSLDVQTVLQNILDRVQQHLSVDGAILFLVSDPDRLSVHAYRGSQYKLLESRQLPVPLILRDYPLLLVVMTNRQATIVPDTALDAIWKPFFGKTTTRSWLGVPIFGGEQVIGVCAVENDRTDAFTGNDVRFVEALASQAAVAVNNAWLFDQVRTGRERMRALSRRLVEAQEKERRYIARELHDETSQALVYLKVVLELLKVDLGDPQKVQQGVAELEKVVEDVLENIHRLTADLRPASLDHLGLAPALRQFIENITAKQALRVNLQIDEPGERLSPDIEISLYRMIQEGLTNVVRHAKASHADVQISIDQGKIITRIIDDGTGFNWDEALRKERLGLLGMRERAEMLGGSLRVDTADGCGTQLWIEVPYASSNNHRR